MLFLAKGLISKGYHIIENKGVCFPNQEMFHAGHKVLFGLKKLYT